MRGPVLGVYLAYAGRGSCALVDERFYLPHAWAQDAVRRAKAKVVFHTSGPTRRFRMGALEVTLKHVSPRRLALAGRPAGTALAALWYLGKREVDEAVIEQVRRRLPEGEFEALKAAAPTQPAWMAAAFRRYEQGAPHG